MPPARSGHAKPVRSNKKQVRLSKRKREHEYLEELQRAVDDLDIKATTPKTFSDLPLSNITRAGLKARHFRTLTDIQAKAIPLALKGNDVLGAARTGSGKTLAFLVPVLENLYRAQCIGVDAGLGALIMTPTRELAIQIFDVLYQIGRHGHTFAAGLVIGGKSLEEEKAELLRMNIVVCTPGRMLQHLSQTAFFNVDNLKMLVLDEADRILDMGFQHDVDAILEYLPKEGRQTLLFSATQTKKVSDLARLSLKDPEYISVHEEAPTATPSSLQQNYITTPLQDKIDTLWSFLQTAKKSKTLVFLSSGKQVRFVYEMFCKLQPGVPLMHLLGRQKQITRLQISQRFTQARTACLFATDVAARGLDFPAVDWVVQVDCSEDADTYIHRVGRTARFERDGRAILFLTPEEEPGMLERLAAKRVPIERVGVRQRKQTSIKERLQLLCFQDPGLKYLGQKAFLSYVRSIQIQKDKEIFVSADDLPLEEFAGSLGLRVAPKVKRARADAKALKNRSRQEMKELEGLNEDEEGKGKPVRTKYDRMFERQNQDVLADHYRELAHSDEGEEAGGDSDEEAEKLSEHEDRLDGASDSDGSDAEDGLLTVKRRIKPDDAPLHGSPDPTSPHLNTTNPSTNPEFSAALTIQPEGFAQPFIIDSNRRRKLLTSKKAVAKLKTRGTHVVFDDDTGEARPAHTMEDETTFKAAGPADAQRAAYVEREGRALMVADEDDRALEKERRREKRAKRKEKERAEKLSEKVGSGGKAALEDEEGEEGAEVDGDGDDLMADFLADVVSDEDEEGGGSGEEAEPLMKRPKKWFEEEVEYPKRKTRASMRRVREMPDEPTLEDLEAVASDLLG